MERLISFFGIFVLIGIAWLFSNNRRKFPLRLVVWGVLLQFAFCLLVARRGRSRGGLWWILAC